MLASVAFVARSQRRSRRFAMTGIAVFVGVAAAISLSFIAGARRSASVVDRFFEAAPRADVGIYDQTEPPTVERPAVLSLPGVVRADAEGYIATNVVEDGTVVAPVDALTKDFAAPPDPTLRVISGALPDGADPNQTVINERFAQNLHLAPGDAVTIRMYAPEQRDEVTQGVYDPTGPSYAMTVAAVVRPPSDIVTDEPRTTSTRFAGNEMLISYDFWEQHHDEFLDFGQEYYVQLEDGAAGVPAMTAAVPSLVVPGAAPPITFADTRAARRASLSTPVSFETAALLALGIGLALAAAVASVLMLRTEQRFHDRDAEGLRALGLARSQLATVAVVRTLPVAFAAGAVAMVGSVALSSRFPIGIGRELELDPGVQVNVAVVLLGAVVTIGLVTGIGVAASLQPHDRRTTAARGAASRLVRNAGAPVDVSLGAHVAFENATGRRSMTTAGGVVGGVVVLVAIGAIGMWVGGVDRLYDVPVRHGWSWDASIGNSNFDLPQKTVDRLAVDPDIAAQTLAAFGVATLDGRDAELFVIDASGTAPPVIVEGRLPTRPDEVALGTRMLPRLGVDIGGTVTMSLAESSFVSDRSKPGDTPDVELTVVGTALAPMFGETDVGDPSIVTFDAISDAGGNPIPQMDMVRFAGTDRSAAASRLDQEFTEDLLLDVVPARVVNMHGERGLALTGIALAGALGVIMLAYVIVAGARSHRRELAVLCAIGLQARRVRRVILWQGALLAGLVSAIALPLSLLTGSAIWRRVADNIGVQGGSVVPLWVFLAVPAAFGIAALASAVTGLRIRRSRVADILREE